MNSYFSTFITGFADVVRVAIKKQLPDVKIDLLLDGLIAYRTSANISEIQKIIFFNNSFVLFQSFKGLGDQPFGEMSEWIKNNQIDLPPSINERSSGPSAPKNSSFKIIYSEHNLFIHMNEFLAKKLETKISDDTGLKFDHQKGEIEFWLLARRERYGVFGLKITRHSDYEKILEKGELRPELAFLINMLSEPKDDDVFFDPFAGSGSIVQQRISFKARKIIAADNNVAVVNQLKNKFKNTDVEVLQADAIHLTSIEDKSVDKIVTDPPWGINVGRGIDVPRLYQLMLKEFDRILTDDGILIILTSRLIPMAEVVARLSHKFELIKMIETLVNGQKATIYKYGHRNRN